MFKKISVAVATTAVLMLAPIASAAAVPGDAGHTPGRVVKKEFRNVKRGMTVTKVNAIFDARGRQSYVGFGYQSREYKTPSKYGFVFVDFDRRNGKWIMTSKSAYWG